jgi:hypothetical protein
MWQEERSTMWCVRACDASSQQYLEEEAGYGQADYSIIPVTRKLHGPASHWALTLLPGAGLQFARGNSHKYAKKVHNCLVP